MTDGTHPDTPLVPNGPVSEFGLSDLPDCIDWKRKKYYFRVATVYEPEYNHHIPAPYVYSIYRACKVGLYSGSITGRPVCICGSEEQTSHMVEWFESRFHGFLVKLRDHYTSNLPEGKRDRSDPHGRYPRTRVTVDFPRMVFE